MSRPSRLSSSTNSICSPTTWWTGSTTSCSSSRTVPRTAASICSGLYDGWALTERERYGVGELPDRIIVYREPHLAACETEDELRDEVHTTLVHEIAHFYGIDDDRLHELGWA